MGPIPVFGSNIFLNVIIIPMKEPYIFESKKNKEQNQKLESNEAIIMLPDIYCQTNYSKRTVEEFARVFGRLVFLLDYFYIGTNKANDFNESNRDEVHNLMESFRGDDFVSFLQKAIPQIKEAYPQIKSFTVIGFCFGGKLAYIAGGEQDVSKIISFYGSGAHRPSYVSAQSAVEYLVSKKKGNDMKVVSFFGTEDPTIPEEDRVKTKEKLLEAGIDYESHEYNAGHAYFQEGRKNWSGEASKASWEILKNIFRE